MRICCLKIGIVLVLHIKAKKEKKKKESKKKEKKTGLLSSHSQSTANCKLRHLGFSPFRNE